MDNPTPPIMPQAEIPPVEPVMPPPDGEHKKTKHSPWVIIAGVILLIVIVFVFFAAGQTAETEVAPTPTPTATASAVSNRILSSVASQSAFTKFETDLNALTLGIQNAQIQNQQLLPPRLELPLGF